MTDLNLNLKWYVITTLSNYEKRVEEAILVRAQREGLEDRITRVLIPVEKEVKMIGHQKKESSKKVFPGYVLVEMDLDDATWNLVRTTPGVTGFISSKKKPLPLSPDEVEKIMMYAKTDKPVIRVEFEKGQVVRVTSGPFAEQTGAIDEIFPEKGTVRLVINLFGRDTPAEIALSQIEKV